MLSIWTGRNFCCFVETFHNSKLVIKHIAGLTLSHTIPTFNDLGQEGFSKHCMKRRNAGKQHFFHFPQCFLLYQGHTSSFKLLLNCHMQMLSIWTSLNVCHLVKG